MTLTTAEERLRGCLGKSRAPDEALARAQAMHLLTLPHVKAKRAWVYRCGFCRGWHITTRASGNLHMASVSRDDPWVPPRAEA